MSTSRYSKSDVESPSHTDDYPEPRMKLDFSFIKPPRSRRKWTAVKLVTIGALLLIDLMALMGSHDLIESLALVILVIINLWAINCAR
jgi:hypothetical protein